MGTTGILREMEERCKQPLSYFGMSIFLKDEQGKEHKLFVKLDNDNYEKICKDFREWSDSVGGSSHKVYFEKDGLMIGLTASRGTGSNSIHSQVAYIKETGKITF